jgi:hypothetical protein
VPSRDGTLWQYDTDHDGDVDGHIDCHHHSHHVYTDRDPEYSTDGCTKCDTNSRPQRITNGHPDSGTLECAFCQPHGDTVCSSVCSSNVGANRNPLCFANQHAICRPVSDPEWITHGDTNGGA